MHRFHIATSMNGDSDRRHKGDRWRREDGSQEVPVETVSHCGTTATENILRFRLPAVTAIRSPRPVVTRAQCRNCANRSTKNVDYVFHTRVERNFLCLSVERDCVTFNR